MKGDETGTSGRNGRRAGGGSAPGGGGKRESLARSNGANGEGRAGRIVRGGPPRDAEAMSAEEILRWALDRFHPRVAFASSFGAEDVVVIDLLARIRPDARVFTLDTGRLHEETYEVMERIRVRYGLTVEVHFPERSRIEALEREKGLFSFRESVENRRECCRLRKVEPLGRALAGLEAWITGLRRGQAGTRVATPKIEPDPARPGVLKINPLAGWTEEQVWEHIRRHDIPVNALHARGFPSIGCAPCTRAVAPGEDLRAGRWWWEDPAYKECGLHVVQAAPAGGGSGAPFTDRSPRD